MLGTEEGFDNPADFRQASNFDYKSAHLHPRRVGSDRGSRGGGGGAMVGLHVWRKSHDVLLA